MRAFNGENLMKFLALRIVPLSAALAFLIAAAPASAAKDACALVPLSQVQRILGAGTTITANTPPRLYKGMLGGALCTYTTPGRHSSAIAFASYPSPAMAKAYYNMMMQRAPADQRPAGSVKGNTVVWGGVHDLPGGKLNGALSRQLINAALSAL